MRPFHLLLLLTLPLAACGDDATDTSNSHIVVADEVEVGRMVGHKGQVFWTSQTTNSVYSARMGSSDAALEVATGIDSPFDIDADGDAIAVCAEGSGANGLSGIVRVDGESPELLADVSCTRLTVAGGYVYFTQHSPDAVSRVAVAGGEIEQLATLDGEANGIALTKVFCDRCQEREETVFVALDSGDIVSVPVQLPEGEDTRTVTMVAERQGSPIELTSDTEAIYWVSDEGVMAKFADFDEPLLLASGEFDPDGLAILPSRDTLVYASRITAEGDDVLVEINTRSSLVAELATVGAGVLALGIDEKALYWSELDKGRIVYIPVP